MPDRRESEGRNRWRTARERDRRIARREIRTRVASAGLDSSTADKDDVTEACSSDLGVLSDEQIETIQQILRHVEAGKASAFSLMTLSRHFLLLNKPIPTSLLSFYKIRTLCTSRFGTEYGQTIQAFVDARETCTLMEYAAWLGEYQLLGPMIAGGLDPTLRGKLKNEMETNEYFRKRQVALSVRILKRFFDFFPSSLSSYIVKRVVDMRLQFWKDSRDIDNVCNLCQSKNDPAQLSFGAPCHHCFCENCLWQDILDHVDDRDAGDVVLCPVCGLPGSYYGTSALSTINVGDAPYERCQKSLTKYQLLPANQKELKRLGKRPKQRQRPLSSSWSEAVLHSVGSSQDIRTDKFFNFTERNAYHYVRGCLMAGADVNGMNVYGQTCLHIAAWRGYSKLVKLLLHFGADPAITANGGVTAESTSEYNGHAELVHVLRRAECVSHSLSDSFTLREHIVEATATLQCPRLKILLDVESDYPGAGSYLIDGGISSQCINAMVELWQSLPPVVCESRKNGAKALCSIRSYYCDSEGILCKVLKKTICSALGAVASSTQQVLVFPHFRFLNYAQPGGSLAPHTDLPRTDLHGNNSTHTLILYLSDCESGGETSLLGAKSSDGRDETLARVSPRRGRLLLFPHNCRHEGNEVIDVPKVLLRGEVKLTSY